VELRGALSGLGSGSPRAELKEAAPGVDADPTTRNFNRWYSVRLLSYPPLESGNSQGCSGQVELVFSRHRIRTGRAG